MADTTIANVSADLSQVPGPWGPYWVSTLIGVVVYADDNGYLTIARTTNGGSSWTESDLYTSGAGTLNIAVWFDQETPGDTGTNLNIAWMDYNDSTCYYITYDISAGSAGTIRTVDSGITVASQKYYNRIAITKTVSGNIIVIGSTQTQTFGYKSDDNFATSGTSINDPVETANEEDWLLAFPACTADDNDAACIFWDRSADEISVKMYDDSADSWTETSIDASAADQGLGYYINMDGSIRHSDGAIILGYFNEFDSATADFKIAEIIPDSISSPTVTGKTDVVSNVLDCGYPSIFVNQQNDDIYAAYCKGGNLNSTVDVVYHISTNDATSWGTENTYSESNDDLRYVNCGSTVGSGGGRFQPAFNNDDIDTILVNLVYDVEIAAASGATQIAPSDATHSTAAGTVATSVERSIAPNSSAHATLSDNAGAALATGIYSINPDSSAHSTASDVAQVSTERTVSPDSATHTTLVGTAGAAISVPGIDISPDSTTHATYAEPRELLTNRDASDSTYKDSSVHALNGWTNVGAHDANNKVNII